MRPSFDQERPSAQRLHWGWRWKKLVSQHKTLQPRQAGCRSATMVLKSDFWTSLGVLKSTSSKATTHASAMRWIRGVVHQWREGVGAVTVVGGSGWRGWGGERERVVRRTLRRFRPSLPCFLTSTRRAAKMPTLRHHYFRDVYSRGSKVTGAILERLLAYCT